MVDAGSLRPLGVWQWTDKMPAPQAAEFAGRLEELEYSALWLPETFGRDPFAHIGYLASNTSTLIFATGIASIFHRHPGVMGQGANTLAEQHDDRFLLGIGVSHARTVAGARSLDYSKPLTQMREYLAAMDASPYRAVAPAEPPKRLLAALGPKMLELACDAADGALPFFSTPEHTAGAREILGADKLLCVEQKVVLTTDADVARAAALRVLDLYAPLPNYRNNWKRLGFTDDEIDQRDNRFVDAVVAWGDADTLRRRLQDHFDAGADHVCIQALPTSKGSSVDMDCLEALAPANG